MVTASLVSHPTAYIPQGLDPSTNKELSTIWSQVQARVVALAGGDSGRIKPLGIDGVLAQLDSAQKGGKSSPAKETVRKTFERTLALVQTVGGIAAGAASSVFGPSELCFNALSFVIDAWQGYHGIYDELAGLMEKCTDYLSRLQYHVQAGMDANLTKVACQHLLLFVEICDRTVKLRSKRMKLLAVSKMFFFREDSVTDLLDKMANLVDKEGRLVAAQTFSLASEAASSSKANLALTQGLVDSVGEYQAELRKEKNQAYRTQTILRSLAFDESKLNADRSEPEPFWQTIYRNYLGERIPGTGEWVFAHPAYTAWEHHRSESPILAIEGGEGSGKSFLASTIISHLRQQKVEEETSKRIASAFYFLEGDSREELKSATNLENVAKSLVWQFSQAERQYLKSAASICETLGEIDPAHISRHLLFGNQDLAKMDVTLFIVIDGLGDTVGEGMIRFLQRACTAPPGQDIRVLLTGDSRCFEHLANVDNIAFDTIAISQNNHSDVEIYIERQMDRMPAVADRSRFGIPELRARIRSRLCEQTKGDFFKIDTTLAHISKLEYLTDIEQALDNASKERSQQIIEEIETLNETRSEKEIAEINEIILWIVFCRDLLSPKELAAALYVKSGERSLLPLEQKFKMKYPLFEINNNGRIDFRSSEIENFVPVRSYSHAAEEQYDTKVTHPAEVAMVKHFLITVCPPDVYAKFNFDDYLAQKSSRKTCSVYKDDPHTGETKMALACLEIITQELDKKRTRLLPYARKYLLKHLAAVDLALADITCKSGVGSRLIHLVTDGASLDRLLDGDESTSSPAVHRKVREAWLYDDSSVSVIVRWLSDSAVISGASEVQRQWVDGLLKGKAFDKDLLEPAAKRMAVHFVQEPHFKPFTKDLFLFLLGYINKILSKQDNQRGSPQEPVTPTLEQIEEVEQWCEVALHVQEKNSLWHVQIGILLAQFGYTEQAESRARQALGLDPLDWRGSNLLADVVSPEEGIAILKPVAERLQKDVNWLENPAHKMDLSKLLFSLGTVYWNSSKHDLSIPVFRKAMEIDHTDYGRIFHVLCLYSEKDRWSDITASLETIQSSPDSFHLPEVLIGLAPYTRFHQVILQAALHTNHIPLLETSYERAINLLLDRENHRALAFTRYHYGNAMYALRDRESKALTQWELALQQNVPHCSNPTAPLALLISKLGPVYLHYARSSGPDLTAATSYLDKLSSLIPDLPTSSASSSGPYVIFPPQLYLARYYQTQGDHAKARSFAKDLVKQALDVLSDDDEDNDPFAYISLLCVFIPLKDDANALAALSLLARIEGPNGKVHCDGDCAGSWPYEREMFWCRDCIALTLERSCFERVKGDQGLLFSVCERSHEFWVVPEREDLLAPGEVRVGENQVVSFGEWIEGIGRVYLA